MINDDFKYSSAHRKAGRQNKETFPAKLAAETKTGEGGLKVFFAV